MARVTSISRGQASVQLVAADGTTEERTIITGISNWQYTEVLEGLNEGDQVIVPAGTSATTTTQQGGPPRGGIFMPGMGRPR